MVILLLQLKVNQKKIKKINLDVIDMIEIRIKIKQGIKNMIATVAFIHTFKMLHISIVVVLRKASC